MMQVKCVPPSFHFVAIVCSGFSFSFLWRFAFVLNPVSTRSWTKKREISLKVNWEPSLHGQLCCHLRGYCCCWQLQDVCSRCIVSVKQNGYAHILYNFNNYENSKNNSVALFNTLFCISLPLFAAFRLNERVYIFSGIMNDKTKKLIKRSTRKNSNARTFLSATERKYVENSIDQRTKRNVDWRERKCVCNRQRPNECTNCCCGR